LVFGASDAKLPILPLKLDSFEPCCKKNNNKGGPAENQLQGDKNTIVKFQMEELPA
jgi:hypothetical protein